MPVSMPKETSAIVSQIFQANQRLKAAQLGLQIEARGQKLSLRGTLPPQPNSPRMRPHQQRLSLGLPATPAGLKQAVQQAKVIAAQLIQNTFDWQDYRRGDGGSPLSQLSLTQQIQAFTDDFWHNRQGPHPASAKTTWASAYAPYLRKLEKTMGEHPHLSLTEAIYSTIQATRPNSRSRQICCTALHAFATFLNLELPTDLKSLWGRYSPSQTQGRQLPSDALILESFHQIPNPAWQFVYGIMATYGLRNHEVFFCDYTHLRQPSPDSTVQVLATTKTGDHEVWPFYPEWIEEFNLRELCLPIVNTDLTQTTLQRIGQQVTRQFRRYNLPFSPYDLRHAWAVRTIHFGLSDSVAARMMGHSVAVHTRTYHRWIARRDQRQAVEAALSRRQRVGG